MMQTSMPAQIPQGLAGAIALLKLKQEVNPVAPGPMGAPRPSVVGAMIQEAEQQMGSPPMTDAMPAGGMYGAAENLRNALPMMEQNAQNAQLEQIAQRLQQMNPAETGIAPMAPSMQMAEGGIIGYNGAGDQGQFVAPPVPQAPTLEDVMRAATQMSAHIPTASRAEPLLAEYEQMRKNLPDYGQQEVEAIQKRRAKRESEAAKEGIMAFLEGLGRGGLGGAGTNVMAFNRALRDADEADDKAMITARKAQDALRRGDLENAFKMANASDKFTTDSARMKTDIIAAAERMAQGRYSTEAQLYGAEEKLRISRMQAEAALEQARKDPEMIREMRALGYPLTPAGAASYIRAKAEQQRVSPEALLAREFKIPLTPQGLASLYETRAGARPDRGLTYNEASDNIDKFMNTPAGIQMVQSAQSEAKKQNRPIPSPFEIRQALIEKELERDQQRRAARSAPAAGASTAAPPVGTVMDGYRFKGGDPRNKNNWEKV